MALPSLTISAGDILNLFRLMSKIAMYAIAVFAFVSIMTIVVSALLVTLNIAVLNDIVAIVQIWLPFNLVLMITWLLTVSFAYLAYRLAILAAAFLDNALKH